MSIKQDLLDTLFMDVHEMYVGACQDAKENPTESNLSAADTLQMVVDYLESRFYELDQIQAERSYN